MSIPIRCLQKVSTPLAALSIFACSPLSQQSSGASSAGAGGAIAQAGTNGVSGSAGTSAAAGSAGMANAGGSGGLGGSAGLGGGGSGGATYVEPPIPTGAFITTPDLSQALASVPLNTGSASGADAVVTLDTSMTFQAMTGFGASITDSSSYVLTKYLSADALNAALVKLFDPVNGVGLNFLRQPMGASDFSSVGNFSYDDGDADPMLSNFNLTQDLKATIPVLKQSLAINPEIFILGTPWSPPAWMKNNHSMNGSGSTGGDPGLALTAYGPLAQYFVAYVQAYAKAGIRVNAVTPQNEPQNGSATYPGMGLDAPSELSLIAQNMGPAFKSANLSTMIWAYDHNWDHEEYPETVIGDATAGSFVEGAAFHCYGGEASAMTTFHDKFPMKSIYMTECSGGDWQDDPWSNTIELALSSIQNYAQAVVLWNMALDENEGPRNNGCDGCRGIVTVNSQSGQVTYNVDYYALGHFSKFVRPGALRIASQSSNGALHQVAFQNKSGQLTLVAHNTSQKALSVQIGQDANAMNVSVPAGAALTVSWAPPSAAE
ncbi:MAG TPA: glycoside hydrolase family 30 beta sandwich domain-containing protein [Polyangiaceae bacterium]|nr:glycoside hydrolase family 30 beta sandwich domain-containing protein [Polyangiaceae bacterium]